jgi:hypothetical protein
LNNSISNDQWVIEEIRKEIKFLDSNENEDRIYQNLFITAKVVLTEEVYSHECPHQKIRSQINDLMLHLKLLKNKSKETQK